MKSALDIEVDILGESIAILKRPAPAGWAIVCSGGVSVDVDKPPMLCLTRDLAIREWNRGIRDYIWLKRVELGMPSAGRMALRWLEDPGIYRYAITMQHEEGHRIAEERFAVVCRVWVGSLEDGERLPPERIEARDIEY